jgi:hypothetical protein
MNIWFYLFWIAYFYFIIYVTQCDDKKENEKNEKTKSNGKSE